MYLLYIDSDKISSHHMNNQRFLIQEMTDGLVVLKRSALHGLINVIDHSKNLKMQPSGVIVCLLASISTEPLLRLDRAWAVVCNPESTGFLSS